MRFWWVILDSAFRSSHPLAFFKKRVLKKITAIHEKTSILEFLSFFFSPIAQKMRLQQRYFFANFSKFFTKSFLKSSSALLLLWLQNLFQQKKYFQSWQWSNQYFDVFIMISGHAFTCWTRRVRSLMAPFFVKIQVFRTEYCWQLFFYERTLPYFYLKNPEGFSRVIFVGGCFWKSISKWDHVQSRRQKRE